MCLAAECLSIQECLDMYVWILLMMQEMEPWYELSHTSIMFADELITPTVLVKLGIQKTCTLRDDQYHLLNEVWPEAFGSYCPQMCCHLETMFTSMTQEEYETGYTLLPQLLSFMTQQCGVNLTNITFSQNDMEATTCGLLKRTLV